MKKLFLFFDLEQTILDESKFINFLDQKLLELINGYGGRIDFRNYITLRNNIIKNRMIGPGEIEEIIPIICRLVLPKGYDKIILNKIHHFINYGKRELYGLLKESKNVLEILSRQCEMGIISNQTDEALEPLKKSNLLVLFREIFISSQTNMRKPDEKLFLNAIKCSKFPVNKCIMIGDRLDIDIYPANKIGMKTIRITDTLFNLQSALNKYEIPTYTIKKLDEIPNIIKNII
jgi:FMN phosphatase YigB (HAD superfamily)